MLIFCWESAVSRREPSAERRRVAPSANAGSIQISRKKLPNEIKISFGSFGTPGGNRTHNGPLGGGCYIHLTTEAK